MVLAIVIDWILIHDGYFLASILALEILQVLIIKQISTNFSTVLRKILQKSSLIDI